MLWIDENVAHRQRRAVEFAICGVAGCSVCSAALEQRARLEMPRAIDLVVRAAEAGLLNLNLATRGTVVVEVDIFGELLSGLGLDAVDDVVDARLLGRRRRRYDQISRILRNEAEQSVDGFALDEVTLIDDDEFEGETAGVLIKKERERISFSKYKDRSRHARIEHLDVGI